MKNLFGISGLNWRNVKSIECNANVTLEIISANALEDDFVGGNIHCEESMLSKIKVGMNGDVLIINSEPRAMIKSDDVVLSFVITDLSKISLNAGKGSLDVFDKDDLPLNVKISGAGDFFVKTTRKHQVYNVSGAGVLDVKAMGSDITVKTSGAGKVLLNPLHETNKLKVKNLNITMSGAGDLRSNLNALTLAVEANGAGTVKAKVRDKAKLNISGVGKVELVSENPNLSLDPQISGLGQFSVNGVKASGKFKNGSGHSNLLFDTNVFGQLFQNDVFGDIFGGETFDNNIKGSKVMKEAKIVKDENKNSYDSKIDDDYDDIEDDDEYDIDDYLGNIDKNKHKQSNTVPKVETEKDKNKKLLEEQKAAEEKKVNNIKDRIKKII